MLRRPTNQGKIFISYRREGGGEMARLIMMEMRSGCSRGIFQVAHESLPRATPRRALGGIEG